MIVLDDADPDLVARAVLFGAVGTAGQRCTTKPRSEKKSGSLSVSGSCAPMRPTLLWSALQPIQVDLGLVAPLREASLPGLTSRATRLLPFTRGSPP